MTSTRLVYDAVIFQAGDVMSKELLETILLRFRDLSTPQGTTIQSHKEIIDKTGYVWWGWWAKRGEKVPYEIFSAINGWAKNNDGFAVYLFDSGQRKFYRAQLVEIKFGQSQSERISSPEPEATPEYYRTTEYLAWYKFGKIEEEHEATVIDAFSYLSVPDFFTTDYGERYVPYDDKVVVSTRELSSQDRTIWFLRRLQDDDDRAEVLLAKMPTFDNFLQEVKQASGVIVLLSDLHFPHNGHPFPVAFIDNTYPVKDVVPELTTKLGYEIAGLILAGDVTTRGEIEGFTQGGDLIDRLKSDHKLRETDILTVPGNHDFGYSNESMEKGQSVEDTSPEKAAAYRAFYQKVMGREPDNDFACGFKYLLDGGLVEFAALNTVRRQQNAGENSFAGFGFVGADQLDRVRKEMHWSVPKVSGARVLVLHHHLIPVNHTEKPTAGAQYSLTLDAEAVIRWALACEVDIVIHGHQHQVAAARISRPIKPEGELDPDSWPSFLLCGLGSAGAKVSELGELNQNTMGIMRIDSGSLWLEVYKIRPQKDSSSSDLVYRVSISLQQL